MRHLSDLTDYQWNQISFCFPQPAKQGRKRKHSFRELLNAIFYVVKAGSQWPYLPKCFPPWATGYHSFRLWKNQGLWEALHTQLREHVRCSEDRKRHASAAIIDSQSVKSTELCDARGDDAGKKVNGRKRHGLVDTRGLILRVMVLPANLQDRDAARQLLKAFFGGPQPRQRVRQIWTDGGYAGTLLEWSRRFRRCTIEIVKHTERHTFKVLPRRWVVERTFGRLGRYPIVSPMTRARVSEPDRQKLSHPLVYFFPYGGGSSLIA